MSSNRRHCHIFWENWFSQSQQFQWWKHCCSWVGGVFFFLEVWNFCLFKYEGKHISCIEKRLILCMCTPFFFYFLLKIYWCKVWIDSREKIQKVSAEDKFPIILRCWKNPEIKQKYATNISAHNCKIWSAATTWFSHYHTFLFVHNLLPFPQKGITHHCFCS